MKSPSGAGLRSRRGRTEIRQVLQNMMRHGVGAPFAALERGMARMPLHVQTIHVWVGGSLDGEHLEDMISGGSLDHVLQIFVLGAVVNGIQDGRLSESGHRESSRRRGCGELVRFG